ncbi:MAG: 50S ribosomal protein L19 [Planctomycetota bacterium]
MDLIQEYQNEQMKDDVPEFAVGDTVAVHVRIAEGGRERIHVFEGIVISRKGSKSNERFTVRRIVAGEGVERTFPVHSPAVADVKVLRRGNVRRAKLHFLRDRVGKATQVKEKRSTRGRPKE